MDARGRLLKRELNKQERASDAGMKSAAMGVIPFKLNDDLRAELQAFGTDGGSVNWVEMVRKCRGAKHTDGCFRRRLMFRTSNRYFLQ